MKKQSDLKADRIRLEALLDKRFRHNPRYREVERKWQALQQASDTQTGDKPCDA